LFADISAVTQSNRAQYVPRIIERTEWHARLLNGSDYPLPGVMPLFSVDHFVHNGMLTQGAAPTIKEIREYHPLLFDFVLKRHLRWHGKRLVNVIFETRRFFERPSKIKYS